MATRLTVVGVCIVMLASCDSSSQTTLDPPPLQEQALEQSERAKVHIRITRATNAGPRECRPRAVARLIVNFFAAVNRGDWERVPDFFTPQLGWYSITEGNPGKRGRHFVAYEPDELREYFSRRVRQKERMYLREVDVGYERARNVGHIAYELNRSGKDLGAYGDTAIGKGAIDCESGRIKIWSMAQSIIHSAGSLRVCPGKPERPRVVIGCARR